MRTFRRWLSARRERRLRRYAAEAGWIDREELERIREEHDPGRGMQAAGPLAQWWMLAPWRRLEQERPRLGWPSSRTELTHHHVLNWVVLLAALTAVGLVAATWHGGNGERGLCHSDFRAPLRVEKQGIRLSINRYSSPSIRRRYSGLKFLVSKLDNRFAVAVVGNVYDGRIRWALMRRGGHWRVLAAPPNVGVKLGRLNQRLQEKLGLSGEPPYGPAFCKPY